MVEAVESGESQDQGLQNAKRKKGEPWTIKRCQKAARRFSSREDWAKGAPSSFKAASARGWLDQCLPASKVSKRA